MMMTTNTNVTLTELAGERAERELETGLRAKSKNELVELMESLQVIFSYAKQHTA